MYIQIGRGAGAGLFILWMIANVSGETSPYEGRNWYHLQYNIISSQFGETAMVTQLQSPDKSNIIYPDDNGESMSDNTEQFRLIVWIKENSELLFANDPKVFVAGDLLWYPVEGNNKLCQAPDVMVVFGRPKGYRGSYQQWNEDNIGP